MNYYLVISLILAAVSSMFSLTRQLQMLQQNSYYPSRYFGWLKDNLPIYDICLFLVCSLLFIFKAFIAQTVFCAAVLAVRIPLHINIQKKAIKPLVFTARIKRLFATAIILHAVLITLYIVRPITLAGRLAMDISFAFSYLVPILTLVIWAVNVPVEKSVSLWYINDAKKILSSYRDLKVIGIT